MVSRRISCTKLYESHSGDDSSTDKVPERTKTIYQNQDVTMKENFILSFRKWSYHRLQERINVITTLSKKNNVET